MTISRRRSSRFDNELNIHWSSKNYEENGYDLDLDLLTNFVLTMCSTSKEKWASRQKVTIQVPHLPYVQGPQLNATIIY